jgi:hypothetical protein
MPFKKGITPEGAKPFDKHPENINKNGRPKKLPELDALLFEVLSDEKQGKQAIESVLIALKNKAIKGDVRAIELLLNRSYGKLAEKFDGSLNLGEMPKIIIKR